MHERELDCKLFFFSFMYTLVFTLCVNIIGLHKSDVTIFTVIVRETLLFVVGDLFCHVQTTDSFSKYMHALR